MGELIGKDYFLDTSELRAWSRILDEPISYGYGETCQTPATQNSEQQAREEVLAGGRCRLRTFYGDGTTKEVTPRGPSAKATDQEAEAPFGVEEAGRRLGCSPGKVRDLVHKGLLKRHPIGRVWRFRQDDIDDFWASQTSQTIEKRDKRRIEKKKRGETRLTKGVGAKVEVSRASIEEMMSTWD